MKISLANIVNASQNEKWDAAKVAKFQAKVTKETSRFSAMTSNTTLLDTCQSLGIQVAATSGTTSAAAAAAAGNTTDSSNAKSAAVSVKSLASGQIFALVAAFVYALTML